MQQRKLENVGHGRLLVTEIVNQKFLFASFATATECSLQLLKRFQSENQKMQENHKSQPQETCMKIADEITLVKWVDEITASDGEASLCGMVRRYVTGEPNHAN